MRNCPNCGSPIEPYKCKCGYCGTWYYDLNAFNVDDGKPVYVKFHTPYGDITALSLPELKPPEVRYDTLDAIDRCGHTINQFTRSVSCDIDVTFHAIMDWSNNGSLYTLEVNE